MSGKLDLHMRKVCLDMSDASCQIIESLLDAIDSPPDMTEVFENEIIRTIWHRPIFG